MSATIDERIVEMQFDNRQFEKNVHTTLNTIDTLKSSLNFTGASKGLENIESVSRSITMKGLSGAIETVTSKFSALEVMAITTLSNITNSAVNAGKRMISALTIDPIKTGFSEYETQINAVQTILANTESKGSTLDDVNAALDELNKYADMTIYNFTEMTRNIGTFTAAGVDLDKSVSSIKGIANLAAISGSSSQQASTAMYQLSQALASGRVALQDWNSVVNAGMGGQVFQDALKRTATVMGKDVDGLIKKYGSFRESLTQGQWLTAEVLTETLNQFAGSYSEAELIQKGYTEAQAKEIVKMAETATDAATKVKTFTQLFDTLGEAAQSGWTQTWEILVGDFEEAKSMLTEVSDVVSGIINASSDARNSMLQGWKDLGGRTVLIDALKNSFQGIVSVVTPIKEAFREIFPPITSEQLFAFTEGLKELTSHFKLSETQSQNLKSTFKGLFAVLDIGKQAFLAIWNAVTPLIGSVTGFGDGILTVTGTMGEWLVSLDDIIKKSDIFNQVLQRVSSVIKTGLDIAVGIVTKLANAFKELSEQLKNKFTIPGLENIHVFLEKFHIRMNQVSKVANKFKDNVRNAFLGMGSSIDGNATSGLEKIANVFQTLWNVLKTVGNEICKICSSIGNTLGNMFNNANFDQAFDLINGGLLAGVLVSIQKFVGGFNTAFDEIGNITENIAETLDTVRGCFEAYQQNLQAKTLLTIASAIGILAASILVISTIDSKQLSASLGAVTVLFSELLGSLAIFSRMSGSLKGVTKTVGAMIGISVAVVILATALKKVSSIDTKSMATGLVGVTGLTAVVVAASKSLSKDSGKVMKGATSLVIFATAIKVLASACTDLAQLNWNELTKGLTGVGILMAEVSVFLNTAKFSGKSTGTATGMVVLAAAIKILASACGDFASMNWSDITKGLVAIGGLFAELALFTNLTGNAKHVMSTGTAMVLLSASMKIFASAMKDFSGMSWDEIGRGMTGMAGALTAITIAVKMMPKNIVTVGVGLLAVSSAISSLSESLGKMGNMSWDSIAKSMTALGGAMLILSVGLNAMTGTLAGSAAMVVAASALAIMTPTLSILGAMSWESIVKGLVSLAGAFTVIGVAGALLTPIIPSILALGGAFTLIGVGVLAIGGGLMAAGVGLSALATGFLALAGVGAAGATAIVASLTVIITGVAALIPAVIAKIGEGIVAICEVLIASAPTICEAVVTIVSSVVTALVTVIPQIVEGVAVLLESVLKTIAEHAPDIIQAAIDILLACLRGIADNLSKVIQAAIDIVLAFIDGVAQKIPDIIQAGFDLIISFINGLTDAINNNTDVLVTAIEGLILAIIDAGVAVLAGGVDIFKQLGIKIMNSGLITGIKSVIGNIVKSITDIVIKMKEAIASKLVEFKTAGGQLIGGFIQGLENKFTDAIESARSLANGVIKTVKDIFDIHSPSRVFRNEVGKQLAAGLALGIKDNTKKSTNAATKMAEKATEAAKKGYENFKSWISDRKYYNNLTLEEELYALEQAGKKYAKYADIRKEIDKEVYRVKNEIEEAQFNNAKKWIDNEKYYNRMSLKDELAAWERIQQRYKEGTEKRIEADKEIYKLKNQLVEEGFNKSKEFIDNEKYYNRMSLKDELAAWERIQQKYEEGTEQRIEADKEVYKLKNDLIEEEFKKSKEYIDNEKYYDRMSLKEELTAWKRIQAKYEEGSEQRIEADKEVYKLQKQYNSELESFEDKKRSINEEYHDKRMQLEDEYADKVKSVNEKLIDDIKALEEQYESSIKSRADTIYNSYSLFDAVNVGEDVDSNTLMNNLQGQVDALSSWQDNLEKLAGRNVSEDFVKELSDMGPSAAKQIEALNSMSDSELDKYVHLWEEKHDIATDRATDELDYLRIETRDKIALLKEEANIELDSYRETWNEQMIALKEDTMLQLEELKSNWTTTIGELSDVWTNEDMPLEVYETAGKEAVNSLSVGISNETPSVMSSMKEISDTALSTMSENNNQYQNVGNMVVDGFVKGIIDNKYKIISVMTELVYEVINTVKDTLDIHSPSRVMQSLGQFTGLGFINGLNEYGDKANKAGCNIGESARNGLSNAISKITDVINSDMDTQPTIRPVLDLSNVKDGTTQLNTMFARSQALSVSTGLNRQTSENQNGNSNNNQPVYQFTQNNYSPKALSRIEIYRQTKNQFTAMKGVLG